MKPPPEKRTSRLERLKEEQRALRREVRTRMVGAIIGALGIVAGIAWNDAVRAAIDHFYPPTRGADIFPKFLYAFTITVIISIFIYIISKIFSEKKP